MTFFLTRLLVMQQQFLPLGSYANTAMPWLSAQQPQDHSNVQLNANSMVAMQAQLAMQLQQRAYLANLQSALMSAALQSMSTQATAASSLQSQMPFAGHFGMGMEPFQASFSNSALPQRTLLSTTFPSAPSPQHKAPTAIVSADRSTTSAIPNTVTSSTAAAYLSLLAAARSAGQASSAISPGLPGPATAGEDLPEQD